VKRVGPALFGLLLSAAIGISAAAADEDGSFDKSAYGAASLAQIAATLDEESTVKKPDGRPVDWLIDAARPKSRTVVVATGAERPIDERVRGLIERFVTATRQDPGLVDIYRTEVEVIQDGRRYWLPIQHALAGYWREEMQSEERAVVLVVHLGRADDIPVFVVTSFRELLPDEDTEQALRDY
jgi:hypothetical protein